MAKIKRLGKSFEIKVWSKFSYIGSIALLSHNTSKWSGILGLSFFAWCWWHRESILQGSSTLSEFCTSLSKVLTLWQCVKVKQHYHNVRMKIVEFSLWATSFLLQYIFQFIAHCRSCPLWIMHIASNAPNVNVRPQYRYIVVWFAI